MNKLEYIKDVSTGLEVVSFENVNITYPEHTHIGHYIFGIVTGGTIKIEIKHEEFTCKEGEMFSVALNLPHSIIPISDKYSMISICIPCDDHMERDLDIIRNQIIGNPELEINIAQIAPGKTIGNHIHETQLETHEVISGSGVCVNDGKEIEYEAGVISIMPAKIPHEVKAGDKGLYLFAKFMPALC